MHSAVEEGEAYKLRPEPGQMGTVTWEMRRCHQRPRQSGRVVGQRSGVLILITGLNSTERFSE